MRITIGGNPYILVFRYDKEKFVTNEFLTETSAGSYKRSAANVVDCVQTTAALFRDERPLAGEPLAVGVARQNPKDRFDKNTGRRVALQRLAKDFAEKNTGDLWREYLTSIKVIQKEKAYGK